MIKKLEEILNLSKTKEKKIIAVAAAHDKEVLEAVSEAVRLGIVDAILVGDEAKIISIAEVESICIESI